ncbi:ADP-ribose pyrophosphatase YjhB (NUDIX family) [Amycolatopsis sulphurea]|uniref:ADP-ribose pyrophosphatase YjhB (NUDIX family) n=1 Tax=Amycolatopsis sulphurea TaxID=76022 RepID=A0A2A9FCX8_9PSEU|nr:NUDIX domain-containing protein [Amycolatopsis sulphurea]PFG49287.1 ADP-ribose pyrophosphatase YjhB (NUDIX family) [Amycolatopsis sulphurea]
MTAIDKVAWLHVVDGRVLAARSAGKDTWYLPGGKREPGESDVATLIREIAEELSVTLDPVTARPAGVWETQAHGRADGVLVRMTCYTAEYTGELTASSEIASFGWLTLADRAQVSPAVALILDDLFARGELAADLPPR